MITILLTALLGLLTRRDGWDDLADMTVPLVGVGLTVSAQLAVRVAFFLLMLSLGLFLAAMYAYDGLLMPRRFWGPPAPRRWGRVSIRGPGPEGRWLPRRPPGSAAWVLNRNMQRTWAYLFQPAVLFVAAAFAVLAVPLLRLDPTGQIVLFAILVGYVLTVRWFRPSIGSED